MGMRKALIFCATFGSPALYIYLVTWSTRACVWNFGSLYPCDRQWNYVKRVWLFVGPGIVSAL